MLDQQTLFISLIGFTILSTLLLSVAAAYSKAFREQRLWAWGNVLSCAGLLIGGLPLPLLVHGVLSYGLVGLGLALVLRGLRAYGGQELAWPWLLLICLGAMAGPAWYALVEPSRELRLVVSGLFFGAFNLVCAAELLRLRRREFVLVPLIGLAALGMVLLLRAAFLMARPGASEDLQNSVMNWSLLAISLAQVTITFGLILMVARRYAMQLQQLATLDPMTGALNRKGLEQLGPRVLQRARQAKRPVTLLMVDADRFKSINDRHGHPAGDAVLIHLARQLGSRLRASDLLVRYGGEEFLLLLDGLSGRVAPEVAERLRAQIEQSPVELDEGPLHYTVSIGMALAADGEYELDGLIAKADAALYRAKAAGRDRAENG